MIEFGDHSIGSVGLGRVEEEVIAEERANCDIGLRIERQSVLRHLVQALSWDDIAGRRVAQKLKIVERNGFGRVIAGVGTRGCGIKNRQQVSGLIDHVRPITGALGRSGNGPQVCARDVLADAFIR